MNAHSIHTTALVAGVARRLRLVKAPVVTHDPQRAATGGTTAGRAPILRHLPDQVIFVSRYERERLAESWGKPAIGHVIYSGVERPRPGAIEPFDLEALHGMPPDARVIGFVGRLSPEKAVGDAIAALPRLPDDVVLCIVGEGPEEGALRAEARRRGLEKRVVFAGFSRDVDALPVGVRGAGAAVAARVAAGGAAARRARSACRSSRPTSAACARSWCRARRGSCTRAATSTALVRAIRVVLDDPSRAASMGCAGRERIAQLFDVKRWVDETEALFARIARVEGR